jgi:hypothetical protein
VCDVTHPLAKIGLYNINWKNIGSRIFIYGSSTCDDKALISIYIYVIFNTNIHAMYTRI